MRNRDPHRENVGNILAICLPIVTMQHIRESQSACHAIRKSAWNEQIKEGNVPFRTSDSGFNLKITKELGHLLTSYIRTMH